MYYKGGNLLNMIRQILQDDDKWRLILRGLNKEFYHQTVTTEQVESYISTQAGLNLGKVFDQYLRDTRIPIFEYYQQGGEIQYRWTNAVKDFDMPVDVMLNGKAIRLQAKTAWQKLEVSGPQALVVDPDYYVGVLKSRE
jgi:aminopeptidase N